MADFETCPAMVMQGHLDALEAVAEAARACKIISAQPCATPAKAFDLSLALDRLDRWETY